MCRSVARQVTITYWLVVLSIPVLTMLSTGHASRSSSSPPDEHLSAERMWSTGAVRDPALALPRTTARDANGRLISSTNIRLNCPTTLSSTGREVSDGPDRV